MQLKYYDLTESDLTLIVRVIIKLLVAIKMTLTVKISINMNTIVLLIIKC